MNLLKLEIVTPEGLIFSKDIRAVTLPGSEGEFGVLPEHASLVSLLSAGVIDIELDDTKHELVAINWGHATVDEEKVTVLAEGAVAINGDSQSEIARALEDAKKLIESMSNSDAAIAAATAKMDSLVRSR